MAGVFHCCHCLVPKAIITGGANQRMNWGDPTLLKNMNAVSSVNDPVSSICCWFAFCKVFLVINIIMAMTAMSIMGVMSCAKYWVFGP